MMNKYWTLFIPLLLFTSCGHEDEFTPTDQECVVGFTPAMVAVATTKASSTFLVKDTPVGISAYLSPDGGVEATDFAQSMLHKVTDDVGTLTSTEGTMVFSRGLRYNFYAYSPAIGFNKDSKKQITIPQGTDFMIASVPATFSAATNVVSLPVMSRKCSLLQFFIKCLPTNQLVRNFGLVSSGLTINDLTRTPVTYTLGDGDIKLAGVPLDGFITIPSANFTVQTEGTEYITSSVVLPKVNNTFSLSLALVIDKTPMNLKATIPAIAFAPGKQYLYTVEISDDLVKVYLILNWNPSAWGSSLGAPNAKIEAGEWVLNDETITTAGGTNTNVVIPTWRANPAWAATLGASNSIGSVVGWNPSIPTLTVVGGSNTTTIITPWNSNSNNNTNHSAGSSNGSGSVQKWNDDIPSYTSAGASNTTTTTTAWGTGGSNNHAGNSNGTGSVQKWNDDIPSYTSAGSSNTNSIVKGWGSSENVITAGSSNGSGSVIKWNDPIDNSTNIGI